MEFGDSSSDTGAQTPLVNKDYSSYEDESPPERNQGPQFQKKRSDWRAAAIILGFECLESTAFYGIATNLVVYIQRVLHGSNASSTVDVSTWSGTAYFTALVGALIADAYLGNYRTILLSLVFYLLGILMIVFSAITDSSSNVSACEGNLCQTSKGAQKLVFFSGLYLVAVGSGGVKSALLPFGADQYDDEDSGEQERKSSFFSMFYVCVTFGSLVSGILIVWIQENVNWSVGFGVSALCIALAFTAFVAGTPTYRLRTPRGHSPLQSCLQVLVAAFRKTTSSETVTDLCIETRVEDAKKLRRLLPLWATGVVFSAAYSQIGTTFIQQGAAMDNKVGTFSISPASFSSFEVLCVAFWVLVCNRIIAPLTRLSQLQRMGIGQCLMMAAMAAAAFLEGRRLQSAKLGEPLWILWQAPQYFVVAGSEAFCYVAQLEFFYDQAPEAMKSMCTAMSLLTVSVGSYLSSVVVTLVALATGAGGAPGWVPDDLNEGHLDYYYWMLSGLCALNFAFYVASARSYKPKKPHLNSEF